MPCSNEHIRDYFLYRTSIGSKEHFCPNEDHEMVSLWHETAKYPLIFRARNTIGPFYSEVVSNWSLVFKKASPESCQQLSNAPKSSNYTGLAQATKPRLEPSSIPVIGIVFPSQQRRKICTDWHKLHQVGAFNSYHRDSSPKSATEKDLHRIGTS